jgi:hypothetical protein
MGIGHAPRNKHDLVSGADNVVPDEFFEALSPLLGEAATFPGTDSPPRNVPWLLEENARLRALAVKLSNLVGDLPEREWKMIHNANGSAPERTRRSRSFG